MKTVKTNAMRLLDRNKIKYSVSLYEHNGNEAVDGISVANCLNEDPNKVFKTFKILVDNPTIRWYYTNILIPTGLV